MIKRIIIVLLLLLVYYSVFSDDIQKIPRRVYFVQESHVTDIDENLAGMIQGISNFLYNSISSIIPIVRIYNEERANSIIKVELFDEEEFIKIIITLMEGENELITRQFSYPKYREEYEGFSIFINKTSEEFSSRLDFVLPKVETTDILEEEQYKEAAEETEYLDNLSKTWEFTLWTSGLMQVQQTSNTVGENVNIRDFSMFPLIFDAAWYFNRNIGLMYSFYFDYNDFFAFDIIEDTNGDFIRKAKSDNLFLLNGLGFSYRTISKVAAQFNVILYAGTIRIEAHDDITELISAGETTLVFYMPLAFNSILNINITPNFSIKTKLSLFLNLTHLGGGGEETYNGEFSTLFFQFFSVGASVRF